MCRDKDENILTEQQEILRRWTEYFKEKFDRDRREANPAIPLEPTDNR